MTRKRTGDERKTKKAPPPSVKTLGDLDETLWMMTLIIIIIPSQQCPWHFMDDDTLQQTGLEYFVDDLIDWSKSD